MTFFPTSMQILLCYLRRHLFDTNKQFISSSAKKTKIEIVKPTAKTKNAPVKFFSDKRDKFCSVFDNLILPSHLLGIGRNHDSQ